MRLTTLRLRVGPGRRWYRVVMGLLAVGMMSPVALRAQAVIVAGVADAESGLPLEGAEVLLVRQRRHAFSSAMGEATIRGVPRGVVRIRARRLGYAPAEIDLAVNADTVGVVFRLPGIATQLATVHTEVERLPPGLRDFEARRRQGIGRFLTGSDLERERDRDFNSVVMARFPGLAIAPDSTGRTIVVSRRSSRTCPVDVYLDEIYLGAEYGDWVRTWDLGGIEFYTGAQVPVQYRTRGYGCGVLLLWSRPF